MARFGAVIIRGVSAIDRAFSVTAHAHYIAKDMKAEATLPDGSKQPNNIAGSVGYFGPGPPAGHGAHHYTFEIWGLNAKLGLPATASRADVMNAMNGKVIAKGVYIGMFENK